METTKQIQVAVDFSNGQFDSCYAFLHPDIVWEVVGENIFKGREVVMENCRKTADYFRSVTTEFTTESVLADPLQVVVCGRAAFYREGKRLALISASDWYRFNESGEMLSVRSWCIPLEK